MSIQVRVACTPKEIDDALWLRHQVYVIEEGRYGGQPLRDGRIVDRFDVIPQVAHVLVYANDEPIAGIRLNCNLESGIGLPPEAYFDFRRHLSGFKQSLIPASGSMLAVRKAWRRRRDVILMLYRTGVDVLCDWNASHLFITPSAATVSLYPRMGFRCLDKPIWIDEIGDHVIPMLAPTSDGLRWAFGDAMVPRGSIWRERRRTRCPGCATEVPHPLPKTSEESWHRAIGTAAPKP